MTENQLLFQILQKSAMRFRSHHISEEEWKYLYLNIVLDPFRKEFQKRVSEIDFKYIEKAKNYK